MLATPLSRWVVLLFSLAACGASAEDLPSQKLIPVQKSALVEKMGLRLGQWHTTLKYEDAIPSAVDPVTTVPEAMASELRAKIGTSFETDDCLGYLLPANGALILPGISIADCDFPDMAAGGGAMRLFASCGADGRGVRSTMDIKASYTPLTMKSSIAIDSVSNGVRLRIKLTSVSSYSGACRLKG